MTHEDQQIDLIMNKLTRAQYEQLKSQSLTSENELYYITDDKSVESIISDYVPLSVTVGTQTNQNPLVDKQYVENNYYETSETSSAVQINTAFGDYYKKNETSSAVQINTAFENINIKPLEGKTYDFSTNTGWLSALTDVISAFGGTITNNPLT